MDWNQRYAEQNTPWDLAGPAPALVARLESADFPSAARVFVPGAGRGHDVVELARQGYEVAAIDIAPLAIDATLELARATGVADRVDARVGDLFAMPAEWEGAFDLVYELTCYCAIDPSDRPRYAEAIARCLREQAIVCALMFPLVRPSFLSPDGPPYEVSPEGFTADLAPHGFALDRSFAPSRSAPSREGNEVWVDLSRD